MRLTKTLTKEGFLSYEKIVWRTTDTTDNTSYIYYFYPNGEETIMEKCWKKIYSEHHSAGGQESNLIDTISVLEQVNGAIEREEDVTGLMRTKIPKHLQHSPLVFRSCF